MLSSHDLSYSAAEKDRTAVISRLVTEGYAVIGQILDKDRLGALANEFERLEASDAAPILADSFSGHKTTRYFDLLNEGEIWQRMATESLILDLVGSLLGRDFLLSLMSTVSIEPGEVAQEVHCDDDIYRLPRPHPHLVLNTIWAISDFTEVNGATRVVPGSHLWPEPPQRNRSYNSVALEMSAGSCALILGSTYHGGGANTSSGRRHGVIVNYCAGIMRQQDNLMLGVSPDTVRSFPITLRELVGYRRTLGGAGHVAHQNPDNWLRQSFLPDK